MKNYDINEMADYYFNKKFTITEISKIINVPFSTIKYQLKKHGYNLNNNSHSGNNRKHHVDKSFFKNINAENKAYILGLIVSDGYVDNYCKLTFTSKDKELVEIFKREIKSEHKLGKYDIFDKRTNNSHIRYSLQIASKEIVSDLNELGIHSNKSFNCTLPDISNNFFWHFLRGLFDGDGSISHEKKNKLGRLTFKLIGSKKLISDIKKILLEHGLSNNKIHHTKYISNDGIIVSIQYSKFNDLNFIKNKMYENSENLRLTRKYDLFQTLIKYEIGKYKRK